MATITPGKANDNAASQRPPERDTIWETRRALIWCSVAALIAVLVLGVVWAAEMLLVAFAGVLLGILFYDASVFVSTHTRLPRRWSLLAVVAALLLLAAVGLRFLIPVAVEQVKGLGGTVPKSIDQLRRAAEEMPWIGWIAEQLPEDPETVLSPEMVERITKALSNGFSAVGAVVLIAFLGVLFALQPKLYRNGFMRLIPIERRPRAGEVLDEIGTALRWWLVARGISMAVLGVLTWVGLMLLGIDMALTLALIVALFAFVPYFGFVLSTIPAVVAGMAQSPATGMYVLILYCAIQALETYLITPWAEYQAASLPPALSITTQITMALLVGPVGFILADPLLLVTMVTVRMLYVEDALGDEEAGGDLTQKR